MTYRFLRLVFGAVTRAFFGTIELLHFERIPETGPILILPNHPNGLIDPFLILIHLRRHVSLTAKSTLKKNPFIALLFRLGGVVALHRRQDAAEGADSSKNAEALAEARKRLAQGGAICLFPEGISHNEPQVQPLKTGAARIALEYVDLDKNPGGLLVIPIGIDYRDKQGFRSSVLVRVAEPIDAGAWRLAHAEADAHAFMEEVEGRLRENTLNFEKRKESVIISFAAEIFMTQGTEPARIKPGRPQALEWVKAIESLQRGYERLKKERAAELEALGAKIRAFKARLGRLGLEPAELFLELSPAPALRFAVRETAALLLGLPLAAWGILNHGLPYLFCVGLKNLAGRERDVRATYAIFGAILVFPLFWAAGCLALWLWLPWPWALAWALSLLPSLWAALSFRDRFFAVIKRSMTFGILVLRPRLRRELVAEVGALLQQIRDLGASLS